MKKSENRLEFFDGESIENNYVELGNTTDYIYKKEGLSLKDSLDFLYTKSKRFNYFFMIDYDVNMIFAKVKLTDKIISFFNSEEIEIEGYTLLYFRNKILSIKKGNRERKFYDISNFLNTSFLKTLEKLEIEISETDLEYIEKYKNKRSNFSDDEIKEIIEYNKKECQYGIEIVKKIYSLLPDNLKHYSLYGSSGVAQKFLKQNNIDKNNPFNVYNKDVFEAAYFGGRMEAFKIGTFKNIYKYDINSAYPSVIKDLREIKSFEKIKYKNQKIVDYYLYNIETEIFNNDIIGMLPQRLKGGYLIFPAKNVGYYYGVELKQVISYAKKYNIDIKIKEVIKVDLGEKIFPKNEIETIYKKRLEYKKNKDLRHYVFKILLNSIYGKFAQKIGKPKFQNFFYAGYITAVTRAKLLEAVKDNVNDIIFFATDGILSTKKLKLKIGLNLGEWEEVKIKKAVVLLSGVYELEDTQGEIIKGERGFKLNFDEILPDINTNGEAILKLNAFIGNKYFYKNQKAFEGYRCKFKEIEKRINPLHQIKREFFIDKFDYTKKYNSFLPSKRFLEKINELPDFNLYLDEIDLIQTD